MRRHRCPLRTTAVRRPTRGYPTDGLALVDASRRGGPARDGADGRGFDHLTYEDAGHFITPPALPKSHRMFGGTPAGLARADRDSWPRVLETLAA
ncbi:hypothetical protein BRC65_01485, partial [Halobacteriales archaeon QH_2_65_14]